jgi:hypothetical protein
MSLARRLRSEAAIADRYGQYDRLREVADAVEALEAEHARMRSILAELGFCPVDGDAMPCMTCGAGL